MLKVTKSLAVLFIAVFTSICLADVNDVIIQEGTGYFKDVNAALGTGYFKDLVVDSNLLYADSNTGRVGIGIAHPQTPFHVSYDMGVENKEHTLIYARQKDESGAIGVGIGYRADGTSATRAYVRAVNDYPLDFGNSPYPQAISIAVNGKVGIGTTNPQYKLDVEGPVQATQFITGDIFFQKDGRKLWRMFEDEKGLYVENLNSGKVYNIVMQGKEKNNAVALEKKVRNLQAENETLKERIDVLEKTMQRLAKVKKVQQ